MTTTIELQLQLLCSALESLHAISNIELDQIQRDQTLSRDILDRHIEARYALNNEINELSKSVENLVKETYDLQWSHSVLQSQREILRNRMGNLKSQTLIQQYVIQPESPLQWTLSEIVQYLDPRTLIKCSLVCKKWNLELLKLNAFLRALGSFRDPFVNTDAAIKDFHSKFTLTIFQLDKFSYICDIDSNQCSSCVSKVETDESRLIIYICEREPATYIKELAFARQALATDKCIQEMNSDTCLKKSSCSNLMSRYERLVIEEKQIQAQVTSLSKRVLDLKTQCASDSHTLMFLERELDSMSNEYKFGIQRENVKRSELIKLKEDNNNRRCNQDRQRALLLERAALIRE